MQTDHLNGQAITAPSDPSGPVDEAGSTSESHKDLRIRVSDLHFFRGWESMNMYTSINTSMYRFHPDLRRSVQCIPCVVQICDPLWLLSKKLDPTVTLGNCMSWQQWDSICFKLFSSWLKPMSQQIDEPSLLLLVSASSCCINITEYESWRFTSLYTLLDPLRICFAHIYTLEYSKYHIRDPATVLSANSDAASRESWSATLSPGS